MFPSYFRRAIQEVINPHLMPQRATPSVRSIQFMRESFNFRSSGEAK